MDVVRVEGLNTLVSFKPKEIQVAPNVFDAIPPESFEDFEVVMNKACERYWEVVDEYHAEGKRAPATSCKRAALEDVVLPFVSKFGVDVKVKRTPKPRVVKSVAPKISDPKEPIRVVQPKLSDEELVEKAHRFYDNNFDESVLDDSVEVDEEKPESVESALGIESEDFLETDFDLDFAGLEDFDW